MTPGRILVTGATGFLGGALIRRLRADGQAVVGLGRDAIALRRLRDEGIVAAEVDIADPDGLAALGGQRFDAIVHCAALSSAWGRRRDFIAANVTATRNLVAFAKRAGAARFILVSSSSVYFRFADQIDVCEDMVLPKPVNAYAWSKGVAEQIVLGEDALRATVLRPRGLYGRGDPALLPRLLRAARQGPLPLFRGGHAAIDLTHVDDVVAAIEAVLARPEQTGGRTYNVSGGVAIPVTRIVTDAARHAGQAVTWRPVPWPIARAAIRAVEGAHKVFRPDREPRVTAYAAGLFAFSQTLDIGAIARDTGWRPAIDWENGLRRTFAPEWAHADHQ